MGYAIMKDTYQLVQEAEKAGFSHTQAVFYARSMAEQANELLGTFKDHTVTKGDLEAVRQELKGDIQMLSRDLKIWTVKSAAWLFIAICGAIPTIISYLPSIKAFLSH